MVCNIGLYLHLLVNWLLVTEIMSQSYKGNYDGYVFTSPGFSAYRTSNAAQTLCAQNGSNLLEIKSSYVQNLTVRFLRDTGVQFADGTLLITNGIRNDFDWIWVNGQDKNSITVSGQDLCLGHTCSFGYINFSPSSVYITATMPTDARGYICQVAGTFDCTNGFSQKDRCFKSYNSPTMSWFDARNQCLNEGGDLASFEFINDNQGLNSTLRGSWLDSSANYWVGLRRQSWTWKISKLEAKYTNWANGRPVYREGGGNRCLCLYKSGTDWEWNDCECKSEFPFVCLTEPPTTSSTCTSTSTTQITPTISLGLGNATAPSSKASTMEPPFSSTDNLGLKLGIGIGVGLGGPLIIAAIIIVLFIVIRKRGCPRSRKTISVNQPDVTLHEIGSHYAEIPKSPGYDNRSPSDASNNQSNPPVVYSELDILTGSPFSDGKDSAAFINSKTDTLPSPINHKGTTHFTVDGLEYAEIKGVGM